MPNEPELVEQNGKRRVLIVEDEDLSRILLGRMLEDTYELYFAETGEEARSIISAQGMRLSLVLLDLVLPDLNGLEILKEIKSDPELSALPVIVLSAEVNAEAECLAAGAMDFIAKPYPETGIILARAGRAIELSEDREIILKTERDQLTGLLNREYFFRYAELKDLYEPGQSMDAIVVDINQFHLLNERFGKAFCDGILSQIGERLRALLRQEGGIAGRMEADTFLIYCPHRNDYTEILKHTSQGLTGGPASQRRIRLRMGVYSETDPELPMERRFERAKLAADSVRSSVTRVIAFYDNTLHESQIFEEQLLGDFREGIENGQFILTYQPKFDVRRKQPVLVGGEVLVRWQHPKLGLISPGVFIPLFERSGLIQELDSYIWREAARQLSVWKRELDIAVPLSVNVSRIDIYDEQVTEELEGLIREFSLEPSDLVLEITEAAYMAGRGQTPERIHSLKKAGFRIEMDDFGTGTSSLNMLQDLPIDALKLDIRFIQQAFSGSRDLRMLRAVISLASSLGIHVAAEGVETEEEMRKLKELGCDLVQGYYFSKPVPAASFEDFLRAERLRRAEKNVPSISAEPENPEEEKPLYEKKEDDEPLSSGRNGKYGISLKYASGILILLTACLAVLISLTDLKGMLPIRNILFALMLLTAPAFVLFLSKGVLRPLAVITDHVREQKHIPAVGVEEIRSMAKACARMLREYRSTKEKLTYEATHDRLTGLYNRSAYDVLFADADQAHVALLLIDVDRFKLINDNYGHIVGDAVLRRVADVLKESFRSTDIICRIGGDEFAVIMTRMNGSLTPMVLHKIEQMNVKLQNPDNGLPAVSLSVGVAFSDRVNPEGDLFRDADTALYRVKAAGRCGCSVY